METPKTPMAAQKPASPTIAGTKKPNIWAVVSIILAIVLIGMIATNSAQKSSLKVITAQQAGDKLIDFLNQIYGPQVGIATLKEISESNGVYKATVTVMSEGQPVEQPVFITFDGEMFMPQAIDIDEALTQFKAYQEQLQQAATAPAVEQPTEEPAAEEPVTE